MKPSIRLPATTGPQIVRGHRGGVLRRTPPALELARICPELPDALGRGIELRRDGDGVRSRMSTLINDTKEMNQ